MHVCLWHVSVRLDELYLIPDLSLAALPTVSVHVCTSSTSCEHAPLRSPHTCVPGSLGNKPHPYRPGASVVLYAHVCVCEGGGIKGWAYSVTRLDITQWHCRTHTLRVCRLPPSACCSVIHKTDSSLTGEVTLILQLPPQVKLWPAVLGGATINYPVLQGFDCWLCCNLATNYWLNTHFTLWLNNIWKNT